MYRENGLVEILENPKFVPGDDVLPKFKLDLRRSFRRAYT